MKIKLMLADDHRMFREALRGALISEPDIEIISEVGTGQEVIDCIANIHPDILILDISLPDMSGIEVTRRVQALNLNVLIVALSGYSDSAFVNEMLKAGARAYVVKSAGTDELITCIRAVKKGHNFLSSEITALLVNQFNINEASPITLLGAREKEVLRLLAGGMQSAEIAEKLNISVETVKSHRRNIKRKLNISSTAELTRYAIREGLTII